MSTSDCVIWTGARNSKGYGTRTVDGRRWLAHRFAYVQAGRPLLYGTQLHHLCGNRLCVNPGHLEAVSARNHNRAHLAHVSAAQVIEGILSHQNEGTRKELLAAALAHGLSENAVDVALSRLPFERIRRGVYRMAI